MEGLNRPAAGPEGATDDRDYHYRRAEEELERARAATVERVAHFHYRLAEFYLDLVYGAEGDPRAARPAE